MSRNRSSLSPWMVVSISLVSALLGALALWAARGLITRTEPHAHVATSPAPVLDRSPPRPHQPPAILATTESPTQEHSSIYEELNRRCAHVLWLEAGGVNQLPRELSDSFWDEAKPYLDRLIDERAYAHFQKRGGPDLPADPVQSQEDRNLAEQELAGEFLKDETSVPK